MTVYMCVGIQVSRGVAIHGLSLNCSTDLSWFQHIVPCGVADKDVTSLTEVCHKHVPPSELQSCLVQQLASTLRFNTEPSDQNYHTNLK